MKDKSPITVLKALPGLLLTKIHRLKKDMDILIVGRVFFSKTSEKDPVYYCNLMKTLVIGHF